MGSFSHQGNEIFNVENGSILTLGSLCLPFYLQDTVCFFDWETLDDNIINHYQDKQKIGDLTI